MKGAVPSKAVDKIIDCLFKVRNQDLSPKIKGILRPQIDESIKKLAEMWKNK